MLTMTCACHIHCRCTYGNNLILVKCFCYACSEIHTSADGYLVVVVGSPQLMVRLAWFLSDRRVAIFGGLHTSMCLRSKI